MGAETIDQIDRDDILDRVIEDGCERDPSCEEAGTNVSLRCYPCLVEALVRGYEAQMAAAEKYKDGG